MRILIFTTQDRFFLSHIVERAVYFKKHNCIVGVAAQKTSDILVKKIESLGFEFYDTKIERQSVNPFSQIAALFRLFIIQKQFRPYVCFNLGAKAIFYGTFISKLCNSDTKVINAPIGLGFVYASQSLKAKCLKPIVDFLYRIFLNPKNSKVIVENTDDIDYFVEKGYLNRKDAFCIYGAGVDKSVFYPLPFEKRNSVFTVVMASRLISEKGVWDFIKAATLLYKRGVSVRMQLVGEPDFGNPSTVTAEEFESMKEHSSFECLGFREDIASILQHAHICCLPSYYREGLPRILIEGVSSGLAIITTDTVGCKEVIRKDNGYVIKPHSPEELSDRIEYLVQHPSTLRKMCINSREVALENFETSIICKKTFEVFKLLCD